MLFRSFDDGPHPKYTEQLLDGLKERNVVATFFVTGENAENYPEIIRREQEEGHLIGNHTYSHIQLTSRNREAFREELVRTNAVLEEITGEKPSFVRPPYGSWDKSFEKELNMFPVLWNIDPLDWCSHNAECIAARVVEKAGDGDIILMHDYYDTSVIAALEVIDALQKEVFFSTEIHFCGTGIRYCLIHYFIIKILLDEYILILSQSTLFTVFQLLHYQFSSTGSDKSDDTVITDIDLLQKVCNSLRLHVNNNAGIVRLTHHLERHYVVDRKSVV